MLEGQLEGKAGRAGWKAPEWAVSIAAGSYFWARGRRGWWCCKADTCRSHAGLGVWVEPCTGCGSVNMATGKGYETKKPASCGLQL